MKSLQLQTRWTAQAVSDRTGQRLLSISNNPALYRVRRRIAVRRNGVLRLAVTAEPQELSGFEPGIRVRSWSKRQLATHQIP